MEKPIWSNSVLPRHRNLFGKGVTPPSKTTIRNTRHGISNTQSKKTAKEKGHAEECNQTSQAEEGEPVVSKEESKTYVIQQVSMDPTSKHVEQSRAEHTISRARHPATLRSRIIRNAIPSDPNRHMYRCTNDEDELKGVDESDGKQHEMPTLFVASNNKLRPRTSQGIRTRQVVLDPVETGITAYIDAHPRKEKHATKPALLRSSSSSNCTTKLDIEGLWRIETRRLHAIHTQVARNRNALGTQLNLNDLRKYAQDQAVETLKQETKQRERPQSSLSGLRSWKDQRSAASQFSFLQGRAKQAAVVAQQRQICPTPTKLDLYTGFLESPTYH